MKIIMHDWERYVKSWMNPKQLQRYKNTEWRRQHDIRHSAFSTYIQDLSGCKFLLRRLIALPILKRTKPSHSSPDLEAMEPGDVIKWYSSTSSAAQPGSEQLVDPEVMLQLTREWNEHKNSPQHQEAVRKSEKNEHVRLSHRIRQMQRLVKDAEQLAWRLDSGKIYFDELSEQEQKMVLDYDTSTGVTRELEMLLAQKAASPPYPGAGCVG